jgi:hypothetical protein
VYRIFAWRRKVRPFQRVPLGSSLDEVFAADPAVSEPTRADSTVPSGAGEGSLESDQAGSNTATGSRGGAGERRDDEPTQYRPVALEIGYAIV